MLVKETIALIGLITLAILPASASPQSEEQPEMKTAPFLKPMQFIIDDAIILEEGRANLKATPEPERAVRSKSEPTIIGSQLVIADESLLRARKRTLRHSATLVRSDFRSEFTRNLEEHVTVFRKRNEGRLYKPIIEKVKRSLAGLEMGENPSPLQTAYILRIEQEVKRDFHQHQLAFHDFKAELMAAYPLRSGRPVQLVLRFAKCLRENFILAELIIQHYSANGVNLAELKSICEGSNAVLCEFIKKQRLLQSIRQGTQLRKLPAEDNIIGRMMHAPLDASCVEGFYGLNPRNPDKIIDEDGTERYVHGTVKEQPQKTGGILSYLWPWGSK